MIIETVKDYAAMSSVGASIIYEAVMRKLAKGERFNLGLATGNTMITLYDELAASPRHSSPPPTCGAIPTTISSTPRTRLQSSAWKGEPT